MADPLATKKEYILALKKLRHLFNNLKEVHGQHDITLDRLQDKEIATSAKKAKVHD